MLEKWEHTAQAGELLYRERLLGEIKTHMISVIKDYAGAGIENEAVLVAQTETLFTGEIIPTRDDWETLNTVLRELSTVKEQGQMYEEFIQDVSDSLGVSDLEKIKNFIDYIQGLAPLAITANITLDNPEWYTIENLRDSTTDFWDNTTLNWNLSNNYLKKPQAHINIVPSLSEDIEEYFISITAGSYTNEVRRLARDTSPYVLTLDWLNWFSRSQMRNARLDLQIRTIDKRGNQSIFNAFQTYPSQVVIPQGVQRYEVDYRRDGLNWQRIGQSTARTFTYAPPKIDGTITYRVRALDISGSYTPWAETTPRFVHFIPKPKNPTIEIGFNNPDWYKVINVRDSTTDKWDHATVQWDLSNDYLTDGEANIGFVINGSEEGVTEYEVIITAGTYRETYKAGAGGLSDKTVTLKWTDWFNTNKLDNATMTVQVRTTGIRGESLSATATKKSPGKANIAQGVSSYDINLKIGNGAWTRVGTRTVRNFYYDLPRQNNTYRWSVRARDKSGSYTAWAFSAPRTIRFIPDPPPKPSPKVTTTVREATITWKPVARAEYYEIWHGGEQWAKDNTKGNNRYWSKVSAGKTLSVTHKLMNEGKKYTWNVRAVNEGGSNIGSTTATQKKYTVKTKTYRPTGTNVWRGGYHRIWKNWSKTWYGAKWRYTNSNKYNDVYQGAWHDANWGGWAARSGGSYWAHGGQKWGNNASYIYFDYGKIRKDLKGKNIQSVTITLTRKNSIHGWATGKPLYLYNHNKTTSQGPGNIDMYRRNRTKVSRSNQEVTQHIKFARGQTEVVVNQNTKELWQNIINGHMKGLGIVYYYGAGFNADPPVAPVNYMYFNGNIKVDVKYKDG